MEAIIKASYRDKTVSQTFVNHTLDVYRYTNALKRQYPGLKVYLRRDISRFSYFPSSPPDAFLSLKIGDAPKRFFLDVIPDSMPRNILDRRITSYLEFFDEGGWEATNSDLPSLLLVTEKGATEARARRAATAAINRADIDDTIEVCTTTFGAVRDSVSPAVWTNVEDADELLEIFN